MREEIRTLVQEEQVQKSKSPVRPVGMSIEQVLAKARTRIRRLAPDEANDAMLKTQAILIDIRSDGQRATEGSIAGALVIERNVLEWRCDPRSDARLPVMTNLDLQLIVICSEGYSSSLAARDLQGLGFHRATDVTGGFQAWRAMGLPIVPPNRVP
jgi:rhodanese-related sulfurtransferase